MRGVRGAIVLVVAVACIAIAVPTATADVKVSDTGGPSEHCSVAAGIVPAEHLGSDIACNLAGRLVQIEGAPPMTVPAIGEIVFGSTEQ